MSPSSNPASFVMGYAYAVLAGSSTRTLTYPGGRVATETFDQRGRIETQLSLTP